MTRPNQTLRSNIISDTGAKLAAWRKHWLTLGLRPVRASLDCEALKKRKLT